MTSHLYGLISVGQKYGVKRFSTLVRLHGGGYRVLASLQNIRSKHWERVRKMAEKPVKGSNYPLEFWMSRGYPMGPYLRGL